MEQLSLLTQGVAGAQTITTREGSVVDISEEQWHLPYSSRSSTINFDRLPAKPFKDALKHYVSYKVRVTSTHAGLVVFNDVLREIIPHVNDVCDSSPEKELIDAFEKSINMARKDNRLWSLYRPIQWYIWSAQNHPELDFCKLYAIQLKGMTIPSNPKGHNVRNADSKYGQLDPTLELPLIIDALKSDTSDSFKHLQQRAVMALSIAFGRNPANLTYLKESDLSKLSPFDKDDPCYVIKIPRIKKRQLNPRDDFVEEYLDPFFGKIIEDLILANKNVELVYNSKQYTKPNERPLFIKIKGNTYAKRSNSTDDIFNMTSPEISDLSKSFVLRHKIISPLTGSLLNVSVRRFRYTLGSALASEGASMMELARILDHSDTGSVQCYYDTRSSIVAHLDEALASQFSEYVSLFKGNVINSDDEAINGDIDEKHLLFVDEHSPEKQTSIGVCGELEVCHLDPPFSCYLCPKFQPYRSADHEHVLGNLLEGREKRLEKYENARLGIQLDDVILAVSNVIKLCKEA